MSMNLSQTIREARKARGITQEQLAALVHVSRQTVSHWENERAEPAYDMLKALADALDMDVAQFFGSTEAVDSIPAESHIADTPSDAPDSAAQVFSSSSPCSSIKPSWRLPAALCIALLALLLCVSGFIRIRGAYSLHWYMQADTVRDSDPCIRLYTRQTSIPIKGENGYGMWEFPLFFKEENGRAFKVSSLRLVWFRNNGTQYTEVMPAEEFAVHTGSPVIGPNEIRLITIGKPSHYGFTHFACALTGTDDDGHTHTFRLVLPLEQP